MKKVFPCLCLFSMIIISALPAFAYHWTLAGQGNYVDADSIRPTKQSHYYTGEGSGSVYTMWTKFVADEQPIERMFGMKHQLLFHMIVDIQFIQEDSIIERQLSLYH